MASRVLSEHFFFTTTPKRRLVTVAKTRPSIAGSFSPPELSVISEILDGKLYLSGCEAVTSSNLASRGVTAIVCAMTPWEEHRTNVVDRTPSAMKKFRVPITDSETTDIGAYFDAVTRFIDDELKSGGRVLVHCVAGVSRSTTLVLAYLIRYRGYSLLDAFDLVAERRRIAWPNDGFYRQLINYERSLRNKNHAKTDTNRYVLTRSYVSRPRSPGFGHSSFSL